MKKNYIVFILLLAGILFPGLTKAQLPKGMTDLTSGLASADANFALTTEDDRAGTYKSTLEIMGDKIFFTATSTETGDELYISDGTKAGTVLLKDINPGSGDASPRYLVQVNGKLYFQANDGTNGVELWESDGTASGTKLAADIYSGTESSAPDMLTVLGDKIIFRAKTVASAADNEKWLHVYDPATGIVSLVSAIQARETGDAQIRRIQVDKKNKIAYFIGQPKGENEEMYKTDGTGAGTVRLMDITPEAIGPSNIQWPYVFNDSICIWRQKAPRKYAGADSVNYTSHLSQQLWYYDGIEVKFLSHFNKTVGTDGNGEDTQMAWPFEYKGKMYFRAHDGVHGVEMCTTDWTEAGTRQIQDLLPGDGSSWVEDFAVFKGLLVFNGNAGERAEGGELRYLEVENDTIKLYAFANPGNAGSWPKRITTWKYDGKDSLLYFVGEGATTGGPELCVAKEMGGQAEFIGSLGASGSTPHNLKSWNNALFFTSNKVNRLFRYVYTIQPKLVAEGDLVVDYSNMLDTLEITISRISPDLFTNKVAKIQLKSGDETFLTSSIRNGPFGLDPIYTPAEDESKFYIIANHEVINPNSFKTACQINITSPDIDSLKLTAKTVIEPVFHHELIYHVDLGNDSSVIDNSIDVVGSHHSVYDQVYGADPVTGKQWGRVRASWGIETSSNKWASMREQNYIADPAGLFYEFEIETGTYVIQYGWYEIWGSRTNQILVNGVVAVESIKSVPLDYLVGQFETTITGDKLSFNVISTDNNNPYLSWFKIGKKCEGDTCSTACFEPICDLRTSLFKGSGLGISSLSNNNRKIFEYPNLAKEFVNVVVEQTGTNQISLYDMTGKLVYSKTVNNQNTNLDIKQLKQGIYLLKVSNSKVVHVIKLVV